MNRVHLDQKSAPGKQTKKSVNLSTAYIEGEGINIGIFIPLVFLTLRFTDIYWPLLY